MRGVGLNWSNGHNIRAADNGPHVTNSEVVALIVSARQSWPAANFAARPNVPKESRTCGAASNLLEFFLCKFAHNIPSVRFQAGEVADLACYQGAYRNCNVLKTTVVSQFEILQVCSLQRPGGAAENLDWLSSDR